MSKYKKAGMLIILLAFPAFFFLFLKKFGTNHYDLPYFHPMTDSLGRVILHHQDTLYYQLSGVLGVERGGDTLSVDDLAQKPTFFLLSTPHSQKAAKEREQENRFIRKFGLSGDVHFLATVASGRDADSPNEGVTWLADDLRWGKLLRIDDSLLRTFPNGISLVLVDGNRHIRGYYDLADPEDFDRAVAEGKILLYQKELERN